MTAGGTKRVRVICASADETIEIQWRRRTLSGTFDQVLTERHSAPPPDVWKARLKEPDDRTDTDR
jgi:hypothetical protein